MVKKLPIKLLVIDDEPSIRKSLVEFISDYDIDVDSAESAEEALEILKKKKTDVIIVDLRLPGISGDAFIFEANKIYPCLQFLIYTGFLDYQISDQLKKIGLTEQNIFYKPVQDLSIIVHTAQKLVELKE